MEQIAGLLNNQPVGVSVSDANCTKACSKCRLEKPIGDFYRKASAPDGRRAECKDCTKASMATKAGQRAEYRKRHYQENRAEIIAYQRAYREENAELVRADARERYYRNRDARKATMEAYRKSDPAKYLAMVKAYREKNIDAVRERERNKRARRLSAPGTHTAADVREIFNLQKGLCPVCRRQLPKVYHVDHIMPLARGGTNDKKNLQVLCPSCNMTKHAADPVEFMQRRGFLL